MSPLRLELADQGHGALRIVAADGAHLPERVATEGGERVLLLAGLAPGDGLRSCLLCGHPELFTAKDFPRTLGLLIVIAAAVLAPFTYYASLGAAALLDALLYRLAPNAVICYVCGARHHGFAAAPRHPRFDREIAERLRYGERAVMGKPMRAGGTADGPDPEH